MRKTMNIKKIIVLLLFLVAIIGIIAPVNATLGGSIGYLPYTNSKTTKIPMWISSDIDENKAEDKQNSADSISKRKAEINKVNKVVFTVKGYKPVTINKPAKGWKTDKDGYSRNTFTIKGTSKTLDGKSYSVKLYDRKNKLLNNKHGDKGIIGYKE